MKKLTILLLTFIPSYLFAQELHLQTGQEFEMQTSNEISGPSPQSTLCNFQFKVISRDGGNTYLRCSLARIKSKMTYGEINSDKLPKTQLSSTYPLLPLALLQNPFTIVLSNKGELKTIEGLDEIVKQAVNKWQLPPAREKEMLENAKGFPQWILKTLFFQGSPSKIDLGTEWYSIDTAVKYKVTGIKGALLDIKYETPAEKKAGGDLKGSMVLNTVTGLIEFKELIDKHQEENFQTREKVQVTQTWRNELIAAPKKYIVDTAWIKMAVKMSYWSDALKHGGEYDNKTVRAFLQGYEKQFRADPYYAVNKLDVIQRVKDNYEEYRSQLIKTPNHYIAETAHHLSNKIGDVLAIHPDSAYAVSAYLIKTPLFYSWVQNSYAQNFRSLLSESSLADMRKHFTERGFSKEKMIVCKQSSWQLKRTAIFCLKN
ncbi:DUF6263 family protein [Desertivirga arenae]|uniref:DUF6263 family protein n=1 Tax=Desertivirga arenae TaxID=2810309 RepID=UPI001A979741|nr:DUF6263 family protein [Pedobacter sp. SYSU D00823]